MPFQRSLSEPIMKNLQKEPLFHERLVPDIRNPQNFQKGNVFAAVRNDQVAFYYKGGKLFGYDGKKFTTHVKHAVKVKIDKKSPYVSEDDLSQATIVNDFCATYPDIKNQCKALASREATFVSGLYSDSYIHYQQNQVVLLDIEAAFSDTPEEEDKNINRIDIVLYNQEERRLRFVEAKLYTNSAMRSKSIPAVVHQVAGYYSQITSSKSEILQAYVNYIEIVNTMFSLDIALPEREGMDEFTELLIVDYRGGDLESQTFRTIRSQLKRENVPYYHRQSLKGKGVAETIWKEIKGKPVE